MLDAGCHWKSEVCAYYIAAHLHVIIFFFRNFLEEQWMLAQLFEAMGIAEKRDARDRRLDIGTLECAAYLSRPPRTAAGSLRPFLIEWGTHTT